ncbi:hypothetical protein, partial [Klebsiella variicola]|uniref:hypothetical protein n=2 Tax=Klebsiella variicola TaxID=244366 RepID=UPI0022309EC9
HSLFSHHTPVAPAILRQRHRYSFCTPAHHSRLYTHKKPNKQNLKPQINQSKTKNRSFIPTSQNGPNCLISWVKTVQSRQPDYSAEI